jgi:hypothetical protein
LRWFLSAARRRSSSRPLDPGLPLHYSSSREAVKVDALALVMGTLSGLRFVAPSLEPSVLVVTALAMHVTYAVICRIFAAQYGRSPNRWMVAGLLGGALATLALLVVNEVSVARDACRSGARRRDA